MIITLMFSIGKLELMAVEFMMDGPAVMLVEKRMRQGCMKNLTERMARVSGGTLAME